jgi:predicted ester cyclase
MSDSDQSVEERNKATIRRFIEEAQNTHDLDLMDEISMPDCQLHHPAAKSVASTPEERDVVINEVRRSFSDFYFEIQDLVAEGNLVAARLINHATNDGPMGPAKAVSNKVMAQPVQVIYTMSEDGRIADVRIEEDIFGMMEQLGQTPGPARRLYWMSRLGVFRFLQRIGKLPREQDGGTVLGS